MKQSNDRIDITRQLIAIQKHWYYYLIAVIGAVILITLYASIKSPTYLFRSTILIEKQDGSQGKMNGMMQMARSFSMSGLSSSSVDNEMLIFRSHNIILNTVKDLNLNINYIVKEGLSKKEFYGDSPIVLSVPSKLCDTLSTSLEFKVKYSEGRFSVTVKKGMFNTVTELDNIEIPTIIKTPYGDFNLSRSSYFNPKLDYDVRITVCNYHVKADDLYAEISIDYSDKKADGITLEYKDVNKVRGSAILNKIMELYNERRINQRAEKANAEINSINERIGIIIEELHIFEKNVESYKANNMITDISSETKILLTENSEYGKEILILRGQIEIIDMVIESLNRSDGSLVPMSEGLNDKEASSVIARYNELLMAKMTLSLSAKDNNASLISLNEKIDVTRENVTKNVMRTRQNVLIKLNDFEKQRNQLNNRIKKMPKHEREYISLLRDQALMNDLYMFLLEKRESAALKLSDTAIPGFIIDEAYNNAKPDNKKLLIVVIILLLLAGILPTAFILIKLGIRNRIDSKHDIPTQFKPLYITDIPKPQKSDITGDRNALKIIRSKLAVVDKNQVIAITSNYKTECKANLILDLAQCLSSSDYNVLVIDAAAAASSITKQCNSNLQKNGLTNYIKNTSPLESIIATDKLHNISIICRGNQEDDIEDIIITTKFNELINQLKTEYDFILINSPIASVLQNSYPLLKVIEHIVYVIDSKSSNRKLIKQEPLIIAEYEKMMIVLSHKG